MKKILLLLLLIGFMGNDIKAYNGATGDACTYNTDCNWANACVGEVCTPWGGQWF